MNYFEKRATKLTFVARIGYQITSSATWAWNRAISPIYRSVWWVVRKMWRAYLWLWQKVTVTRNPDPVIGAEFSRVKGGVMLIATGLFFYYAALPLLDFVGDCFLYALTAKSETVFLTNAQEIDPHINLHSAQGCRALPCEDDNSVYFRIRTSAFNEAWSLAHGRGMFFPDYVAAAIPPVVSKCTVLSYGIRMKLFVRWTDIYPDLLESSCQPITEVTK